MKYEISSGNSPAECELAVPKFAEYLVKKRNIEETKECANDMRISHVNLERGNAVAKFEGEKFKRVY